jgi:hypothetical protein
LDQRVLESQREWRPVGYPEASTLSQDIRKGYLLKAFLKRYTATLSAKVPRRHLHQVDVLAKFTLFVDCS